MSIWLSRNFIEKEERTEEYSLLKKMDQKETELFNTFIADFLQNNPLCGYNAPNYKQDDFHKNITYYHYHLGDPYKSSENRYNVTKNNVNTLCINKKCSPCLNFSVNLSSTKKSSQVLHYLKNEIYPNDIFIFAYGIKHTQPFPAIQQLKSILGGSYSISNFRQLS